MEIDGQSVCKVAVSIDGTWQKRGHSSKIGVVFAVSVMTGEIIDYEVKSLICKECSSKEHTQGVKLTFFSDSHLAPKFFKVVANSKKVGRHFQRQTKSFFTLSAF